MGFGIDRRARSRKGRGLFRRGPDPKELGDRLGWLVRRMTKVNVLRNGWKGDHHISEIELQPGAPALTLDLAPDGERGGAELHVTGETWPLGPGYHADALARLAPTLDELELVWIDDGAPATLPEIQQATCAWLARELAAEPPINLGVERRFLTGSPVLTPLGPRDEAWRAAVRANPLHGMDMFAWWETGKGRAARARALRAMWLEVPWREPLDDAERTLMEQVDADLRAARKADPELALPWPAWAELLSHMGIEDEDVLEHAGSERTTTIGYRRFDLEQELSGGWLVTMPGSFVGAWEDDGGKYWATDGDRTLEFTSLTAHEDNTSEELLQVAPEHHPVIGRITDPDRCGRVEAYDDAEGVHVVIGIVTSSPHVAILTCKSTAKDDAWPLAVWRSIHQKTTDVV